MVVVATAVVAHEEELASAEMGGGGGGHIKESLPLVNEKNGICGLWCCRNLP